MDQIQALTLLSGVEYVLAGVQRAALQRQTLQQVLKIVSLPGPRRLSGEIDASDWRELGGRNFHVQHVALLGDS